MRGTFAPERRASDRPIAIACFGFVTFLPEPLFSLPRFISCIVAPTFFDAFSPYFALSIPFERVHRKVGKPRAGARAKGRGDAHDARAASRSPVAVAP